QTCALPISGRSAGRSRGACSSGTAGQAHKDTHTDCNCECDKRPMLDLVGQAAQCIVTEFSRFAAHGMGPATKRSSEAPQHGGNGRPGAFGSFCRARGCTAANTL